MTGTVPGQVARVPPNDLSRGVVAGRVSRVKCEGCGAELGASAKVCTGCGREVGLGRRVEAETVHVAEKTGEAAGKVGRGLLGGVKGLAAGAKKGLHGSDDEKK